MENLPQTSYGAFATSPKSLDLFPSCTRRRRPEGLGGARWKLVSRSLQATPGSGSRRVAGLAGRADACLPGAASSPKDAAAFAPCVLERFFSVLEAIVARLGPPRLQLLNSAGWVSFHWPLLKGCRDYPSLLPPVEAR